MSRPRTFSTLVIGSWLLIAAILLNACNLVNLGQSNSAVQTLVEVSLQGTLQAASAQTDVANQVAATVAAMQKSLATATPLPPPTATPFPTATPQPAAPVFPTATPVPPLIVPTSPPAPVQASAPLIQAEINTNCRTGPGTIYKVIGYLMKGETAAILGRDSGGNWWYIDNPSLQSNCWVWSGSTRLLGDASAVAVVTAVPGAALAYSASSACYPGYYGCGWNNCYGYYHCYQIKVWVCDKNKKHCHWELRTRCDCRYTWNGQCCYDGPGCYTCPPTCRYPWYDKNHCPPWWMDP